MLTPVRALRRSVWALAALAALAGLTAFVLAARPRDLEDAARQFAHYAADRATSAAVWAAVAALVVATIATRVLAGRRSAAPTSDATPSPLDPLPADEVHARLEGLQARLRQLAAPPAPDLVGFVDAMLGGAVRVAASDLHLHPLEAGTEVSLRVQGVLHHVVTLPREHHRQVVARLKVMAELTTFRTDRPQDGHFVWSGSGHPADLRISVMPTNHGERVVIRVANVGLTVPDLTRLGVPPALLDRLRALLARPQGIVFVTGPTGSGKTTTIYSALAHIKQARGETTQITTIEDPIEFDLPFLTQSQVRPDVGMTFAAGLRSILRQDPNVIMVGEIRDAETAHIAVQAGLTGHQIVTTVHADSAAGVFNRLIEMGVEPFLVASASLGCLSQRLVRALCPHCRAREAPSADEQLRLAAAGLDEAQVYAPRGCAKCDHTGYLGRIAFYELLEVTAEIRELVNAKVPTPRIHDAAVAQGMTPLLHAGLARMRAGDTSLREVLRVCG
jgi:general secretion pathway protein E